MIYRGHHISIEVKERPYHNQVCSYLTRLTPFVLHDAYDDQFVIFIPAHLASIDADGTRMIYTNQETFIDALKLHMVGFDGVGPVTGARIQMMRNKMIEQ